MPLEQPRRTNPLMKRYFDEIGLSGKRLAARAGVSHSQMYMARERHVGARNAGKIACAVAGILVLSLEEELELKAEIMGEPDNLLRAYLGNAQQVAEALDEPPHTGWALISGEPLSHKAGTRVVEKLEKRGAPPGVVSQVRTTVKPPPSPPGRVTYTLTGDEVRQQRARARERLRTAKPTTYSAISDSGLSRRAIYERARVARETLHTQA